MISMESGNTHSKDPLFLASLIIIALVVFVSLLTYFERNLLSNLALGPLPFRHWMGIIGASWIALYTPIYSLLKRRRPARIRLWLGAHNIGNLIAFMLITVHFTYRIINSYFIGTGVALFIAVLTLVVTGFAYRFEEIGRAKKYVRFMHISMTTAFYLVLIVHILGTFVHI